MRHPDDEDQAFEEPRSNSIASRVSRVSLRDFDNAWYQRGRPKWVEALWIVLSALFVASWLPGSFHRRVLLRLFGAELGKRIAIKPGVRVKFPWKLSVGSDTWIGEGVWIDNLDRVEIGDNCCLSQGAYLCTGSHDWSSPTFGLITKPIKIENCAWIGAGASLAPGTVVGEGAVVAMGSTASGDLEPWTIYSGVMAKIVRRRLIREVVRSEGDAHGTVGSY